MSQSTEFGAALLSFTYPSLHSYTDHIKHPATIYCKTPVARPHEAELATLRTGTYDDSVYNSRYKGRLLELMAQSTTRHAEGVKKIMLLALRINFPVSVPNNICCIDSQMRIGRRAE